MKKQPKNIEGVVRGFTERKEQKNHYSPLFINVWNFRLERFKDGNQLPVIPIEIRGININGFINEGDTIKLLKRWKGGMHFTNKVFNVTTNVIIKVKKRYIGLKFFIWILCILIILFAIKSISY